MPKARKVSTTSNIPPESKLLKGDVLDIKYVRYQVTSLGLGGSFKAKPIALIPQPEKETLDGDSSSSPTEGVEKMD